MEVIMKFTTQLSILTLAGSLLVGCATVDSNSEEAAVKRLVANDGKLAQNVDTDFEGEAYDQNGDKVVCKKIRVTGSRIGQYTVCKTEAEWETAEDDVSARIEQIQGESGALLGD